MAKRTYTCQYCGRDGFKTYKAHRDHEYRCALNPKNQVAPDPLPAAGVEEIVSSPEPETTPGPKSLEEPETETYESPYESTEALEEERPPLPDPPPVPGTEELPPGVVNLIDARMGVIYARLEEITNQKELERGQVFNSAVENMPKIIETTVLRVLSGQGGGGETAPPAPPPGDNGQPVPQSSPAAQVAGKGLSLFGQQFNWQELAMEYLKAKGKGNPMTGLVQLLTGQANKKVRATDAKYSTRGMNNMSAMLRLKGSDPVAMAIAHKSQAEQMLKESIPPAMRDYYIGQKSQADAFLAGVDLQKTYETTRNAITGTPPTQEQ